jgi:putative ABC transport system permease protein
VKYLTLIWSGLKRKKTRTLFTLLSVMAAFLLFGLLAATRQAFLGGVNIAGKDRLVTANKVSLIKPLPLAYLNRIKAVQGVAEVSYASWFGGYYQNPKQAMFAFAVDPKTYFDIYPEYRVPPAEMRAWLNDRTGVIVGVDLARQYGWKIGDRLPLQSNIWRDSNGSNTWDVTIDGIYTNERNGGGQQLFLHYKYLNEKEAFGRDTVGTYVFKIADPTKAALVANRVDRLFANSPTETRTSTEKAFIQNFADQLADIGAIVTAIVGTVFFTMLLITANTMTRAIRERAGELAVMKTLGYTNRLIVMLVIAESLALTAIGGLVGLGLAYLASRGLGARLAQFVPGFYLPWQTVLIGIGFIVALGLLAGLLPSVKVLRLNVVTALRKS